MLRIARFLSPKPLSLVSLKSTGIFLHADMWWPQLADCGYIFQGGKPTWPLFSYCSQCPLSKVATWPFLISSLWEFIKLAEDWRENQCRLHSVSASSISYSRKKKWKKNVLETDGVDDCIVAWIYLISQNRTLKNGKNDKFYVIYILAYF